jgi:hypothetical protein
MMSSILASFPGTFARILRRDINAVDLPWSNGQADGQLNRVKTIKLTMYGWHVLSARELTESFLMGTEIVGSACRFFARLLAMRVIFKIKVSYAGFRTRIKPTRTPDLSGERSAAISGTSS